MTLTNLQQELLRGLDEIGGTGFTFTCTRKEVTDVTIAVLQKHIEGIKKVIETKRHAKWQVELCQCEKSCFREVENILIDRIMEDLQIK